MTMYYLKGLSFKCQGWDHRYYTGFPRERRESKVHNSITPTPTLDNWKVCLSKLCR